MNILVIDAQGGIGKQIVSALKSITQVVLCYRERNQQSGHIIHVKAPGQITAATGENPVMVCNRKADVIVGTVGIVIADALLGEITAAMATAVGRSQAKRILVPVNHCDNYIVGVTDLSMTKLVDGVVTEVGKLIG
ncbi:MAG: DUF3842 family protein [Clostridium sp.]